MTLSIPTNTQLNSVVWHYAGCFMLDYLIIKQSVIMLSVVMLNVIMLSVVMLNITALYRQLY